MIEGSIAVFPNNIVEVLATNLKFIDAEVPVVKRRLYATDAVQAIGVSAAMWTPDQASYEMRGPQFSGIPTISRYDVGIMCMVRDMDQERGGRAHAELTKHVQRMVMGDPVLGDSLRALVSNLYGLPERLKRWHIENTRFLSEELDKEFTYLSTTTVRFETET